MEICNAGVQYPRSKKTFLETARMCDERRGSGDYQAGKPVACILPLTTDETSPRKPGMDKGKVIIPPDIDAPLSGFN